MEATNCIFLTGATGSVGRHVVNLLKENPRCASVYCFNGDLLHKSDIELSVRAAGKIDIVINLAAVVPIDIVNSDPGRAYSVNVCGAINLVSGCAENGQKPYVFQCSTAHVYGSCDFPISETDRLDPVSIYGRTKLFAEYALADVCKAYDMTLGIGRVFSIHDKLQKGSFLRPNIERRLAAENLSEPFYLPGADSLRDFLLAGEAAELIGRLALARYQGIINIASGKPTRVRDFVQSLSSEKLDIRHTGKNDSLVANISKLIEFLNTQNKKMEP